MVLAKLGEEENAVASLLVGYQLSNGRTLSFIESLPKDDDQQLVKLGSDVLAKLSVTSAQSGSGKVDVNSLVGTYQREGDDSAALKIRSVGPHRIEFDIATIASNGNTGGATGRGELKGNQVTYVPSDAKVDEVSDSTVMITCIGTGHVKVKAGNYYCGMNAFLDGVYVRLDASQPSFDTENPGALVDQVQKRFGKNPKT